MTTKAMLPMIIRLCREKEASGNWLMMAVWRAKKDLRDCAFSQVLFTERSSSFVKDYLSVLFDDSTIAETSSNKNSK